MRAVRGTVILSREFSVLHIKTNMDGLLKEGNIKDMLGKFDAKKGIRKQQTKAFPCLVLGKAFLGENENCFCGAPLLHLRLWSAIICERIYISEVTL